MEYNNRLARPLFIHPPHSDINIGTPAIWRHIWMNTPVPSTFLRDGTLIDWGPSPPHTMGPMYNRLHVGKELWPNGVVETLWSRETPFEIEYGPNQYSAITSWWRRTQSPSISRVL
jgi:hypothetical protein